MQQSDSQDQNPNLRSSSFPEHKSYTFIIKQDNGQEIFFNPETFHGFTLGYASTVYKAQGKTVPDVLVYHDGLGSKALSYVGLTRHQQDVHLFVAKEKTADFNTLIHQMSREENKQASLFYTTPQEQAYQRQEVERKRRYDRQSQKGWQYFLTHTVKDNMVSFADHVIKRVKDHYYRNEAFYTSIEQKVTPSANQIQVVKKAIERIEQQEATVNLTCHGLNQPPQHSYNKNYDTMVCAYPYKIPGNIKQQEHPEQALTSFLQQQVPQFMKRYHLKMPEGMETESFTQRVVETYQLIRQQQQEKQDSLPKLKQTQAHETESQEKPIKNQQAEKYSDLEIKQQENAEKRQQQNSEQRRDSSISEENKKDIDQKNQQKQFLSDDRLDDGLLLRCAYMHKQIYKTAKQMRLPDVDKMTSEQENRLIKTLSTESKIWLKEVRDHPQQGTSYHYDHCRQAIDMVSKSSQAQAIQELSHHTDHQQNQSSALFKAIQQSLHQSLQQHSVEHQRQMQQERGRGIELSLSF